MGTDQEPPCMAWRVITTPRFTIIFPAEIEGDARRVATMLERLYPRVTATLGFSPRRLPVILRTRSVVSNGIAAYLPRRSEWWNTPPQDPSLGGSDWYESLAVHEFRHIVQIDGLNRGFNRALYFLTGESGFYVMAMLSVPRWFFEGDAVGAETALTRGGRGRVPEFDAELRARLLAGKRDTYFKALFGSYRDWTPLASPYLLGYYLTTHVRRVYGRDAWARTLRRATWLPFVPHWFDFMLIRETGSSAYSLYGDTMNELEKLWRGQIEGLTVTEARTLTLKAPKVRTYDMAPVYGPDGRLFVLRYGEREPYVIIRIDPSTGRETRLCLPGRINSPAASAGGGLLAWSEEIPDIRWGLRSYSEIVTYDPASKIKRFITKKVRLFAPALSPDGTMIAAVEFTESNRCSLLVINAKTGAEVKRFPNPDNAFIRTPRWSTDGFLVSYTKTLRGRSTVVAVADWLTGTEREIVPPSVPGQQFPVSDGRYVYFISSYSGIDNVYAAELATKKIYRVTSRLFGAYNHALSPDGKKLAYNDVTVTGYAAVEMDIDPSRWVPIERVEDRSIRYYEPLVAQEGEIEIIPGVPEGEYESKRFNRFTHLFNFHSWIPFADPFSHELSLTLFSRNLLGTTEISGGYRYNWNERTHAGMATLSYAGWFPVIDTSIFYGGRSSTYDASFYYGLYERTQRYSWRELRPSLGVTIPLNLSRSRFDTHLSFGARGSYVMVEGMNYAARHYTPHRNHNGSFIPLTYFADIYNGHSWYGDIYPRWGQHLNSSYTHTPFRGPYRGSLLSLNGTLWFPGIVRRHSLFLQGTYERQTPHSYRFASRSLFPRGYAYEFTKILLKSGLNYTFPIYDPDWNLLHVLHFKRIFANIFGDYGAGMDGAIHYYRSAGLEVCFEMYLFTIEIPFIIGVRGYYRFDQHHDYRAPYGFDILFGIGSTPGIGFERHALM